MAGTEALPLLQSHPNSSDSRQDRRTCNVIRERRRTRKNESEGLLHPASPRATCYLQDGGDSASATRVTKKLVLACSLAFAFMIVECIGGYFADSVAILSDAAHMFSDVFSFVVSIYCVRLIKMKAPATYSFGYHRAETMGALISILIVCVITGGLVLEAVQRLLNPSPIDGKLMFIIAASGIVFNVLLLLTLGHDHHHHIGGGSCSHGHSHSHSNGHDHEHNHCHGDGHPDAHKHHGCNGHNHSHGSGHNHSNGSTSTRCSSHLGEKGTNNGHDYATGLPEPAELCSVRAHDHDPEAVPSVHVDHQHSHSHNHEGQIKAGAVSDGENVRLAFESVGSSCGTCVRVVDQEMSGGIARNAASSSHVEDVLHAGHGHTPSGCHGHHHRHVHSHDDHDHDHHNQNLRGAVIHVLGDIVQSLGVAVAGAIIWYTDGDPKWLWVDPMCTFIFAISVMWVTKTLIVDVINDLMEAAPSHVDMDGMANEVAQVYGVAGVHDLHVWRIGTGNGKVIMTAHIDVSREADPYVVVKTVEDVITKRGITHSTVQVCEA